MGRPVMKVTTVTGRMSSSKPNMQNFPKPANSAMLRQLSKSLAYASLYGATGKSLEEMIAVLWETHDDNYGLVLYYGADEVRVLAVASKTRTSTLDWTQWEEPFFKVKRLRDRRVLTCPPDMIRTEPGEDPCWRGEKPKPLPGKPLSELPEMRRYGWEWRPGGLGPPDYTQWKKLSPLEMLGEVTDD